MYSVRIRRLAACTWRLWKEESVKTQRKRPWPRPSRGIGRINAAYRLERTLKFVSHRKAKLLLSKAWDHEITREESRGLAEHLEHCPECSPYAREMLAFLAQLENALGRGRTSGHETPPDDAADR